MFGDDDDLRRMGRHIERGAMRIRSLMAPEQLLLVVGTFFVQYRRMALHCGRSSVVTILQVIHVMPCVL